MFNLISDLKQFSIDICNTITIEGLECVILRIKAYIQNNEQLQTIVTKKIEECESLKTTKKYKLFARYLCGQLGDKIISRRILDIERSMYLDWWENINTNNPNGLANLYLIPEPTKKHFERYSKCKYITNYMCYPLFTFFNRFLEKYNSCLNIYMFYQDKNTIYETTNQEFYLLYLKALTNGTLNYLIKAINPNSYEHQQLNRILPLDACKKQKKDIPQEILRLSDTYQESYKIIALYPYKSREELAKERKLALPTFKNHIETLCQALSIDNGITKLREYLNTKTSTMDG